MRSYPNHDEETEPTGRGRSPLLVGVIVVGVVVLMVVLHLAGVLGPAAISLCATRQGPKGTTARRLPR